MTTQELMKLQHEALMEAHQYFTHTTYRNYPVPNCAFSIGNAVKMYEECSHTLSREEKVKKILAGGSYGVSKNFAGLLVDLQEKVEKLEAEKHDH